MNKSKQFPIKISLAAYDLIIFAGVVWLLLFLYIGNGILTVKGAWVQTILAAIIIFGVRYTGKVYRQIWRYGGIQCYIRLIITDTIAGLIYIILQQLMPIEHVTFVRALALCTMTTLGALTSRMVYRYAYKCGSEDSRRGQFLRLLLKIFSLDRIKTEPDPDSQKIKIAIIGAGSVGAALADDLMSNPKSSYVPRCFIDADRDKTGRDIHGITVMEEDEATLETLKQHHIQEVVFAVPNMDAGKKMNLYEYYQKAGFKIKVYDYPTMEMPGSRRQLREFNIEDLLMRKQKDILNEKTCAYYKDKTILITGGGGSIGSELCRQLAKMSPKQLIILDVYENCAYDLEQSLKQYKPDLPVQVEIVSITNKRGLARVFRTYHPDICIHAAAHKHVPLMEHNCIEAVENNVFGTRNVVALCEAYHCNRFMMVSTDKAVNPTNVMGATKRMCEMIMQAYSTRGQVKCSATRFGNVLGSAGSVIPLFKRQIAAGGPVTVTDKRIVRYFMTIPEASQLVLTSGAMANNGDLFVLDMGNPVKIYDLATRMVEMSGRTDVQIIETGLRPGEKLYEELLVKSDTLETTENDLIFIEHEDPITMEALEEKFTLLKAACEADDDLGVKAAMHQAVPTFKTPEEVNQAVGT